MFISFSHSGEMKIPVKIYITSSGVVLVKNTSEPSILDRYVDTVELDIESALSYLRLKYTDLNFDKARIIDIIQK